MLKRILVLDDNQDILDIIKEALSYEKFEVKITSDGGAIFEAIEQYRPDLIMLDYKLNGQQGDDICRQIKLHPQFNTLPVIICSAYITQNTDLLTCGCDAMIAKPFGLEELIEKVNFLVLKPEIATKPEDRRREVILKSGVSKAPPVNSFIMPSAGFPGWHLAG